MLEILRFIFSGFWTFAGTVILLCIIGKLAVAMVLGLAAILFTRSNVNIK